MTPETNPVHPCHGCQSCFAEMGYAEQVDVPSPCGRYPECDPPGGSSTCGWPGCATVQPATFPVPPEPSPEGVPMSLQVLASVAIGVSLILCGYTIGVIAERRRSKRDK